MEVLLCLPHPLPELWLIWLLFMIPRLKHLFAKKDSTEQLAKTGELMDFKEILSVGCVAGFILLTFITAFCTYLVMKTKHVI